MLSNKRKANKINRRKPMAPKYDYRKDSHII